MPRAAAGVRLTQNLITLFNQLLLARRKATVEGKEKLHKPLRQVAPRGAGGGAIEIKTRCLRDAYRWECHVSSGFRGNSCGMLPAENPRPTGLRILGYTGAAVKLIVFIALIKNFNQSPTQLLTRGTGCLEAGGKRRVVRRLAGAAPLQDSGGKSLLTGNLQVFVGGSNRAWQPQVQVSG